MSQPYIVSVVSDPSSCALLTDASKKLHPPKLGSSKTSEGALIAQSHNIFVTDGGV